MPVSKQARFHVFDATMLLFEKVLIFVLSGKVSNKNREELLSGVKIPLSLTEIRHLQDIMIS